MIIKTNKHSPSLITCSKDVTVLNNLVKLSHSNLICISARPGMGKTSLALYMALEYADKCKKPIYIFSFDLCSMEIYERMVCALGKIDTLKIRKRLFSNEDTVQITKAVEKLKQMNIVIDDETELTEQKIIERLDSLDEIGIVIIDSLQSKSSCLSKEQSIQEIGMLLNKLKIYAKQKNIPIIFTHKINRQIERRKNKRPLLKDLKYDRIGKVDLDTIIFIYRNEYYKIEKNTEPAKAEIIIAKNKYDSLKTIFLEWQGKYMKFCKT